MNDSARIEESAVAWLIRREQPEWNEQTQLELNAWLAESTAHRVAWLRMEHGWRRVDRLAALKSPAVIETPSVAKLPQRSRRPWLWAAAAGVLVSLLAVLFATIYAPYGDTQRFTTAIGGHETVPLRDGSKVELNTDTKLRADVDEKTRTVWLDKGEAYFEVAHDGRPFVVYAGDQRVVVLGTHFSVRRDHGRLSVVVAEGKVRMETVHKDKQIPPAIATRGQMIVAEANSMLVAPAPPQKLESELAWRHGYLMFDKTSLTEAVAEFNRYNDKKLGILDADAGKMRISGNFEATNVNAFVRLLQRAYGLTIRDDGKRIGIAD